MPPPRLNLVIELLHAAGDAVLASQSVAMAGYPFASHLPFVADERQRPVFLMSRLAEHTRNIAADAKASLLLKGAGEGAEVARATLVGDVAPLEADPLLAARYVRYHPQGEQFLQLGDFRFYRLEPLRLRLIGGFGKAAWLEGAGLANAPMLSLRDEAELLAALAPRLPAHCALLGLDAYGLDCRVGAGRRRFPFQPGPLPAESIEAAVGRLLTDIARSGDRHGS